MGFKYEALAQNVALQIATGELSAGAPLPSLRTYAQHMGVSLSTASKTYQWLEQHGLIHAKPKSGFFVRTVKESRISQIPSQARLVSNELSDIILNVHQQAMHGGELAFGGGYLNPDYLPVEALQRCLIRSARRNPKAAYSYGHSQGEPAFRSALCEHFRERNIFVHPDQALITNGGLEWVTLAVTELTDTDDVVAIFSPCYSGLLVSLKNCHRKILEIPCGASGPGLDYIESLMREKAFNALIFSAISYNPLGFNLPVESKKRLAELSRKYDIPLIEDDVFGELSFHGEESSPVFSYLDSATKSKVVYCGSFSKSLAAGYRQGWLVSHDGVSSFTKRKLALNLTCSLPVQGGLADYLYSEGYRSHIGRLKTILEQQLNLLASAVEKYFPKGTQMTSPRGGMFLWIRLPDNLHSIDLYKAAEKHNISFSPGEVFSMVGFSKDCIRLSVNHPWSESREAGVKILGRLTQALLE